MTTVILHGSLAKTFGKEHRFSIRKPVDALRALMANKKGFRRAFKTWGRSGKVYEMLCDGKKISTEQDFILNRSINQIDIVPVIIGASDEMKTVIGAVLVVASFYVDSSGQLGAAIQGAMFSTGVSLVIQGVMGMLFPPPTPQFTSEATSKSFIFSSLENSAVQGAAVPLGYGRIKVGTKVISSVVEPERLGGGNRAAFWFPNPGGGTPGGNTRPSRAREQ